MALGADAGRVMAGVVVDAVRITLAGVLVGLAVALAAAQLLRTQLFGVTTYDAVTMIAAPAVLLITAVVACLEPAARAARVDPLIALRAE
jgi:ABC-type antimicrobial peptide transport system permease subunit